ncbi:MAG TPA: response regulator [Ohtaekwangia sp.]|nr:response regulator [Ohtaekwangia sp.]
MKVLVCEDDEIVLKVIEVALTNENVQGIYVRDGREAMKLLQQNNDFDLIITDIHMPYYNGDDILNLVRVVQGKKTPIIMVSSDDEEEVIALALKLGVDEFIEKPLDPVKLGKKLRKFLR